MQGDPVSDVHGDAEHHGGYGESVALGLFRMLVAPVAGRLRHLPPAEFHDGEEWVSPGQAVAVVDHGGRTHEVRSPIDARVAGMLVRNGEPVIQGQPIVWLEEIPRPRSPKRSRSFS